MVSLTEISARLASEKTGITCKQIDINKNYTYLDTLVTQKVSPLLLPPQLLEKFWKNSKRGMAQHPWLALPNNPNKDIWRPLQATPDKLKCL